MRLVDKYVANHVLMCASIQETGEHSEETERYVTKSCELRSALEDVASTYEVMALVHKEACKHEVWEQIGTSMFCRDCREQMQ